MYLKNYEEVKINLQKCLTKYLKQQGLKFKEKTFQCPNYKSHNNEDSKPSAVFFPDLQHYKCFACGDFFDIFGACNRLENKPLEGPNFITDNLLYLAKKFNIKTEIIEENTEEDKDKKLLTTILEETNRMLKLAISSGRSEVKEVNDYIKIRGWEKLYDIFDFGYCNHTKLLKNLQAKGFSIEQITDAGLGMENRILFHDRLVFPIKSEYGQLIGFASRSYKSDVDELPRYMNSANTKLYKKSDVLFNIDKAKNYEKVYIVEGYADVFTLVKHGIENAVALCDLSFNFNRYKLLAKGGVKEIVFCLDVDEQGKQGLTTILKGYFLQRNGLKLYTKEITTVKDPDEFVSKYGIEEFEKLPEYSLFDYFMNLYRTTGNSEIQQDLFNVIINEASFIKKEQMIKKLSENLVVSEDTVFQELRRFEQRNEVPQLLKSSDILNEKFVFEKSIIDFDSWANRRGTLLGYNIKDYPNMSLKLDGIQSGFYVIAGRPNVGKSALCLNLAHNLLYENEDLFIVYFSLDDTIQMVIPRLVAIETGLEINQVMNPVHRIKENKELDELVKITLLEKRSRSLENLKNLSNNLIIKDAAHGSSIQYIDRMLKIYKLIAENRKMVVFIDSFHKVTTEFTKLETREKAMEVSKTLELLSNIYDIPIICTSELRKQQTVTTRPDNLDIKETGDIEFDADVIMMLYSDFYEKDDTSLKFSDGTTEYPVVEVNITKNKKSPFRGKVYYKFIPQLSQMFELSSDQLDNMLL